MKIQFYISVANKSKHLYNGKHVSEVVWSHLNEVARIYRDNENFQHLLAEAKKQRVPEEWLEEEIHRTINLPNEFAQKLHLYDAIYPRSFTPKNKIGEAVIDVMESGDMCLVLYNRTWVGT